MYKRTVNGFRSVLGLLLAVCLLISGIPFEAMEAYAENAATLSDESHGIQINTKGNSISYRIGDDGNFTEVSDDTDGRALIENTNFESAESVTIKVTSDNGSSFYGLRYWNWNESGEPVDFHWVPFSEEGTYTFNKDGVAWKDYEVEIIDWDDCLFDGQYRFVASDSDPGLTVISDTSASFDTEKDFTIGTPINFSFIEDVYKVVVFPNDGASLEIEKVDNSYSYTPNAGNGFEIVVYTSEAAYNYDQCQPNYDEGQFSVEYQVRYQDNDAKNAGNQVTFDLENTNLINYATNGEWTKLVLEENTTSVPLKVTVMEGYGYEVNPRDIQVDNNNVINWDVSRREGSDRPEIYFYKNSGDGEDNPGSSDPTNYEGAKNAIEADWFAYYAIGDDNAKQSIIKGYLATELWYEYFNPGRPYAGMFDINDETVGTISTLENAITLTNPTSQEESEIIKDGSPLSYYEYEVLLHNEVTEGEASTNAVSASGKVYILNSPLDIVIATTYNDETSYQVETITYNYRENENQPDEEAFVFVEGSYIKYDNAQHQGQKKYARFMNDIKVYANFDRDDRGDAMIDVFGNGVSAVGRIEGGSEKVWGAHVTQEHSNLGDDSIIGNIGFKCFVAQEGFIGTKVTGSRNAAAWDFVNANVYEVSSQESSWAEVFYGNKEVTVESDGFGNKVIDSVELDTAKIPAAAATITKIQEGTFTIQFNSGYDSIPIKVMYEGDTVTYYQTIHRIGLALGDEHLQGDSNNYVIWHGTDHSVKYNMPAEEEHVVYASFYYRAKDISEVKPVNLYATIRYKDGTVERRNITEAITNSGTVVENGEFDRVSQNQDKVAGQGTDKYYDDFVVWSGSETDYQKIQSVDIFAYEKSDDSATFGGAKIGSGDGYTWEPVNRQ